MQKSYILHVRIRRFLVALLVSIGLIGPAAAACIDGVDGPKRAPFEIVKAAILEVNFEEAAEQIDLGGKRSNNLVAGLTKLSRAGLTSFKHCILLSRHEHSPNYMTEIVYYSDGDEIEYWLMLAGIQIDGETKLIDIVFSNDRKKFRDWLN